MPCAAVQYAEATYGNNFYYTRTRNGTKTKYGQTHLNSEDLTEIHLNFKLDNSFCNRYYDLDFVANGIVLRPDKWNYPVYPDYPRSSHIVYSKFLTHLTFAL
ncbi:uncharacterized protein LOC118435266 [Folsomia candida]|uniref:uncharacterized protein LOC118435266 n=1 Tax=Folsomia candida TaxID=158441 RepID=UPI0016052472|nr:uncharacterized protein LOC118435266 [Folsomia candida]